MAYEARRNNNSGGNSQGKEMTEDERNIKNNTENLRNAADVAMATKNPYAMAAGAAVKAADKLTGGKSTEALGKVLNQANKTAPGGKQLQKGLNKINESGIGDKVGQAARMKNQMGGGGGTKTIMAPLPTKLNKLKKLLKICRKKVQSQNHQKNHQVKKVLFLNHRLE